MTATEIRIWGQVYHASYTAELGQVYKTIPVSYLPELTFWELTFWEVDILGIDILGVDISEVGILGVDILRLPQTTGHSHRL